MNILAAQFVQSASAQNLLNLTSINIVSAAFAIAMLSLTKHSSENPLAWHGVASMSLCLLCLLCLWCSWPMPIYGRRCMTHRPASPPTSLRPCDYSCECRNPSRIPSRPCTVFAIGSRLFVLAVAGCKNGITPQCNTHAEIRRGVTWSSNTSQFLRMHLHATLNPLAPATNAAISATPAWICHVNSPAPICEGKPCVFVSI